MGEMIHVQLGNCGNTIGKMFLQTIQKEHGLTNEGKYDGNNPDMQLQRINVYFNQPTSSPNQYKARAIIVGDDIVHTEDTLLYCFRKLFDKDDVITTRRYCINWAQSYYDKEKISCHQTTMDKLLNTIRNKAEKCDSMQGIQVMHGIWDGIGAGFGSLLAERLHDQYPKIIRNFYSVMPTHKKRSIPDIYNTVLTLQYLNKFVDVIFCIDLDSISEVKLNDEKIESINYDKNKISNFMSGITTYLRCPCEINTDLRKLVVNLVPYPLLHFFVPGYMEANSRTLSSLVTNIFDKTNMFITEPSQEKVQKPCQEKVQKPSQEKVQEPSQEKIQKPSQEEVQEPSQEEVQEPSQEKVQDPCQEEVQKPCQEKVQEPFREHFFTIGAIFRGNISSMYTNFLMQNLQRDNNDKFVQLIPHKIKTTICSNIKGNKLSVSLLFNTNAIQQPFEKLLKCFCENMKERQYLHYYQQENMDVSQFEDAYTNLSEVLYYYKQNETLKSEKN